MKILIDADGCPVIDITINTASKFNIEAIIMCDTSHTFDKYNVQVITLSKGADSVDFAVVNKVNKGDIVVTQDYGLAAMVLAKGGHVINQNGMIYTNENIDRLLSMRHISKTIRKSGQRTKGPRKRQKEDDVNYEKSLVILCNNILGLE